VFEFTSEALGAQSGVGGGGRYDGLVQQLGGPATPGMGWAAGIERILLAGSPLGGDAHAVDLYVGLADGGGDESFPHVKAAAFEVLSEARSAGLGAQMEMAGRSLKGQRGHADRIGARLLAIVEAHQTVLRDMQDGSEETLETGTVVHAALRRLRDLA
jgi:histidyl-tRNA synthetase